MIRVINKKYRRQEYDLIPVQNVEEKNVKPLITSVINEKKEKVTKKSNNTNEKK